MHHAMFDEIGGCREVKPGCRVEIKQTKYHDLTAVQKSLSRRRLVSPEGRPRSRPLSWLKPLSDIAIFLFWPAVAGPENGAGLI